MQNFMIDKSRAHKHSATIDLLPVFFIAIFPLPIAKIISNT